MTENLIFDHSQDDWGVVASYKDKGLARVEFFHKGESFRVISDYPAYKVWNVSAHFSDIIADFEDGMALAISDGFGGSAHSLPEKEEE